MAIDFRLYCVSDRRLVVNKGLASVFLEAARCGIKAFQIREKDLSDDELKILATQVKSVMTPYPVSIFLNSRHIIARELSLNVHLPEREIPHLPEVRQKTGNIVLGASAHALESAALAESNGADFVVFGPVLETESKKRYGQPQGLKSLRAVCSAIELPVFAIGGITPDNAAACLDAGAHGVACISALMGAADMQKTIGRFASSLGSL